MRELTATSLACQAKEKEEVLCRLKEDLKETMGFANVLKRKLDNLYERVFDEDSAKAGTELETTLDLVGTITKPGLKLQKVTEYRFVKGDP